ncbi:hypothetical protein DZC75_14150 [Pseudomonas parafulva]|uniref:Uncharacterized protein n=1 Tax=Pseudomonas parafulva TaxID=157782 RepID=A0AAI8KDB8_9PSED|nr:hypothetical protein [Pseudomonas parafulva]AXO89088.1 hypothetical protein DZC75_14150 [Pseudomonas parafulva]
MNVYQDPFQIGLMIVTTLVLDRLIAAPAWRTTIGSILFASSLFTLLFHQAWFYHGIDLYMWKSWGLMMGICLMLRRHRRLTEEASRDLR